VKEIQSALAVLAFHDGKADSILSEAANDSNALRQSVANGLIRGTASGLRVYPKGLKHPHSGVQYRDGAKTFEWKLSEVRFFNRFEDRLFVQP
jgi:hypothetical protein